MYIQTGISKKELRVHFQTNLFENFVVSPFGLVPKGNTCKRTIYDLSLKRPPKMNIIILLSFCVFYVQMYM